MTNLQKTNMPHIYRPKWYIYLINLSLFMLMTVFAVAYYATAILPYIQLLRLTGGQDFMIGSAGILLAPVLLVSLITYLVLAVMLIAGMFSTLEINEQGLEYKLWPQLHIRCTWADVHLITKQLGFIEVLQVNKYEKVGACMSLGKLGSMFRMEKMSMPLSKFNGWKNGDLAKDLRRFSPQLFNEGYIDQIKQNEVEQYSSNEKFLSAINHASFFLGFMGIILPVVLWFEQKGKSAYVRYQAMQAIIWNIVVHVLTVVFLIILIIGLSLVVIAGTIFQQEAWMQTLTLIGMVLMALFTLAFLFLLLVSLLYPTIAVIRTAQGNEFEYAWVGKWAKKFTAK
jgi:uncharacterized Tic20 family protein